MKNVSKLKAFTLSSDEVVQKLGTSVKAGLSYNEATARLRKYKKNILTERKQKSFFKKFLEQLSDFMVVVLIISAIFSFIASFIDKSGEYIDSIIILVIIVINAIIGVIQESKAEKAIKALKEMSSPSTNVIRNGKQLCILSESLVPGDIILLNTGDIVSADARLIESYNLQTEESSLTGESISIDKSASSICKPDVHIGDMDNMVFMGTAISNGHATAVVTETGMNTQIGKIANMINKEEAPATPLQSKLADIGKYLGIGALSICLVIFLLGLFQNIPILDMFMISISLAVAAIPEGLPAVVTIVLAMGIRKMADNRAIVRRLPAVETLGSTTVICSDKTGTLTQNKMTVTDVRSYGGNIDISSSIGRTISNLCVLCNNAKIEKKLGEWHATGSPTENALLLFSANNGIIKDKVDLKYPKVDEIPFESNRKLMTTIHKLSPGKYRVISKGAPEILIKLCSKYLSETGVFNINNHIISEIEKHNISMAKNALRVIAVAYKDIDSSRIPNKNNNIENDLIFGGLFGMIDKPRPEVKDAVKMCKEAGIKPVMITGDHIITANAIAKDIGILSDNDKSITGKELDEFSDEMFQKNVSNYKVFARVTPKHKVKIIKALQRNGEVVAMSGDGVNDAPALKCADIGCAMGISGTDVAKNAADMIMTDDNFATIVAAVKEGRGIFENIKKTIHFLLSSNIGEIVTVLIAFLMKLPSPLIAIQLLWVNLVTDSLPALALGVEPVSSDIMKKKPTGRKKNMLDYNSWYNIIVEGLFIGAISLLAFVIGVNMFDNSSLKIGRTMSFAVLSLSQIVHSFNVKSKKSIFETNIFDNMKMIYSFIICVVLQISVISIPYLCNIFKTENLSFAQWFIVILLSLSPLALVEFEKLLARLSSVKKNDKRKVIFTAHS